MSLATALVKGSVPLWCILADKLETTCTQCCACPRLSQETRCKSAGSHGDVLACMPLGEARVHLLQGTSVTVTSICSTATLMLGQDSEMTSYPPVLQQLEELLLNWRRGRRLKSLTQHQGLTRQLSTFSATQHLVSILDNSTVNGVEHCSRHDCAGLCAQAACEHIWPFQDVSESAHEPNMR